MSHQSFKMFTPERVSIILLVAALFAWAAVTLCRRIPDDATIVFPVVPAGDTATCDHNDSTVFVGKKGDSKKQHIKNKKEKKRRKEKKKKEVRHRDHLNEPVSTY